ncbi:MAG: hypothetical protein HYY92_00445 [Parcubacteria group bacterium]|nr:hypothetical protein [Parcubacteria group bacterium]
MLLPKLLSLLVLLFIITAPLALSADGFPPTPIVPPCEDNYGDGTTEVCGFVTLMHLIRHLIDFALFLAMPIAAGLFSWAGFLYLSAGANPGNISKAHGIFWSVFIGLLWVLGAWLVIKLISDALLKPEYIQLGS